MNKAQEVVVHPLVLLSVVDHYNRVAKDTRKRVVGVLLGEVTKNQIEITNSFAVPFEEEPRDPKVWFLDHNYLEQMFFMFKKINAKEKILGWYSTGPGIRAPDIEINEYFKRFAPEPLLIVIDVTRLDNVELPAQAFCSKEDIMEDGTLEKHFDHLPTILGASEAEDVGVEHLLRDVKDVAASNLSIQLSHKIGAMKGMITRITTMA